jgi:hypothetical protein
MVLPSRQQSKVNMQIKLTGNYLILQTRGFRRPDGMHFLCLECYVLVRYLFFSAVEPLLMKRTYQHRPVCTVSVCYFLKIHIVRKTVVRVFVFMLIQICNIKNEHSNKIFSNTTLYRHTYKVQLLVSKLHFHLCSLMSVHHRLLVSIVSSHQSSAEIFTVS